MTHSCTSLNFQAVRTALPSVLLFCWCDDACVLLLPLLMLLPASAAGTSAAGASCPWLLLLLLLPLLPPLLPLPLPLPLPLLLLLLLPPLSASPLQSAGLHLSVSVRLSVLVPLFLIFLVRTQRLDHRWGHYCRSVGGTNGLEEAILHSTCLLRKQFARWTSGHE